MELLIMRHGPAGERGKWAKSGKPDWKRPLTPEGRDKTRRAAAGLAELLGRADLIATSPWARAAQTAELLARAVPARVLPCPALIPDRPWAEAVDWLKSRREKRVVLIGHEPHLGRLASRLLGSAEASFLLLKKGQALFLCGAPAPGKMLLRWSLPPKALRALA